jgi:hypothetical protein
MGDLTVVLEKTVIDPKERERRLAACYRLILDVAKRRRKQREKKQTPLTDNLGREAVTGEGTQSGEPRQ